MIKKYFSLFFVSLVSFVWTAKVSAMGVGLSPTSLDLIVGNDGLARAELTISNPSQEAGLFTVAADDYADWFIFQPSELRLDPQSQQKVKVLVKPNQTGRYASNLSILAYPLDTRSFKAASGVKVPFNLTVQVLPSLVWHYYLGWGLLLLAAIGAGGLIYYHQSKKSWWQKILEKLRLI